MLPSTLPYPVTGVRIAATIALVVAVSAERVSDAPGLGTSISLAQSSGPVIDTWALTFASP